MDHKERFFATIERKSVDRPACFLGLPTTNGWKTLMAHYGCTTQDEVRARTGDDLYPIEMPYRSPNADAVFTALQFAKTIGNTVDHRTLTARGFFEDYEDPEDVDRFDWPDPERCISKEACQKLIQDAPAGYPVLGILWSAHFQDACAAFGMELAMMNMIANPEMYKAVDDRITEFYLRANEIFFDYCGKGAIDAVLIGNDFGSQRGLMLSADMINTFVMPNSKRLVDQAHAYGAKVLYHSCGSIFEAIPGLIDIGVDAIHPIQALAHMMEPERLRAAYGDKISFCGGVDTQQLLVHGSTEDVRDKVRELRELFPTGLILSPSHEAIQEDVSPENVVALFEEATRVYGTQS